MNVQRGTVTLASTELTETVTLPTPVPVGESFATISMRGASGDFRPHSCTAELTTNVGGAWTELVITRENSSAETVQHWQVVTDPKFTVAIYPVDLSNAASTTVAITTIDPTDTFLVLTYRQGDTNGHAATQPFAFFFDNSTVELERQFSRAASHGLVYVVTYTGSTVQAGNLYYGSASLVNSDTITAVDLSQTFVMWTNRVLGATSDSDSFMARVRLTNTTTVEGERTAGGTDFWIQYFVVSHPDLSVQQVDSAANSTLSDTEAVTSVNEGSTFISSHRMGNAVTSGATSIPRGIHTQELASATSVTATRGDTTGSFTPTFFVVEGPTSGVTLTLPSVL